MSEKTWMFVSIVVKSCFSIDLNAKLSQTFCLSLTGSEDHCLPLLDMFFKSTEVEEPLVE